MSRLVYAVMFIALPALAQVSIPLAWNPSPSANVAGYKIYYGVASRVYTASVDVGNVTNATISGLSANTNYYFAATSYNTSGIESAFSSEAVYASPVSYQPPTLAALNNLSVSENAGQQTVNLTGIGLGSGSTLSITATSGNTSLIPNPTVSYTSPSSTGSLKFTPVANATGMAVITVIANNGQSQSNFVTQTFTVTVTPVYQSPTLVALNNLSVSENAGQQTVNLTGIGLGSGSTLSITATSGNTSLIPNPTVSYTSPSSTGSLKFTPAANATGTALITVTANNGQSQSNFVTQTFTVTVTPAYQSPRLGRFSNITIHQNGGNKNGLSGSASVSQSSSQIVDMTGISLGSGSTLTITATSDNPSVIPNPTVNYVSPSSTGSLTLTLAQGVFGTADITVTADNGMPESNLVTQTFTVTVLPDQLPMLDAIADLTMDYNSAAQTVDLTGIAPGPNGSSQKLKITAVSSNPRVVPNPRVSYRNPGTNGTLTVSALHNVSGTATITVTVNDGGKTNNIFTQSFVVTVLPNQLPTLDAIADLTMDYNSAAQTVDLIGIGPGASGELQNLKITAVSSNPRVVPNPRVSYRNPGTNGTLAVSAARNASGTATITVTVNDGGKTNNIFTQSFVVTVLPNQLPTLDAIADLTMDYNSAAQTVDLTGIGPGASGEIQNLKITAVSSNPKVVPNPRVSYRNPGTNGTLTVSVAHNVSGTNTTATITVTVNDGGKTNNIFTQSFVVTVLPQTTPSVVGMPMTTIEAPAPVLSSSVAAEGQFSLTVNGVSGTEYVVQASTDLVNWTPVYTNTAAFTFVDDQSGQFSKRFYRTVQHSIPVP